MNNKIEIIKELEVMINIRKDNKKIHKQNIK